jgi:MinD superfamily P-loop ATPase
VFDELPVLDETRCIGCGDCVAVCPTVCLGLHRGRPWLPRPLDCVSCGACVVVCPTDAIRLSAGEVRLASGPPGVTIPMPEG